MNEDQQQEMLRRSAALEKALGAGVPALSDTIRHEADEAVAGRIHFKDAQYVEIGRTCIDWSGRHIDHHVWHERPNRFLYLPPLVAAYRATGEQRYAEAAQDYIADWIRARPSVPDWKLPKNDNPLNLGIRVQHWGAALPVFTNSPAWDAAFVDAVVTSIGCQLDYIADHLSPHGNFRMVQAMALILTGLRLPFHSHAASWLGYGVRVMNDAFRRQVLADGAHVECTAGYHSWMTDLFSRCLKLQRAFPGLAFVIDLRALISMYDYAVASTRPNGSFCGLNDSEGKFVGSHENQADKRRVAFLAEFNCETPLPPVSQVFPVARQAFLRDGWGEGATYLTFDATRWGSAHGHLARNSVTLHAHGRSLLVDPGRLDYEMSNPAGPYGKSTRAHNTVNLNGWNQNTTDVDNFAAYSGSGIACLVATYKGGYWPAPFSWWFHEGLGTGIGAMHTRILFWVHGRWAVVIDEITRWHETTELTTHAQPKLEINWQFSPCTLDVNPGNRTVVTRHPDSNLLMLFPLAPAEACLNVYEGQRDPMRGWIRDPEHSGSIPAPQLALECSPMAGYTETVLTLLLPFAGTDAPDVVAVAEPPRDARHPGRLALGWPDGTEETILWTPQLDVMIGRQDGVETDGSLLYRRGSAGAIPDVVAAVDATYVAGDGPEPVLIAREPATHSFGK